VEANAHGREEIPSIHSLYACIAVLSKP
jgi:hypothetical protein